MSQDVAEAARRLQRLFDGAVTVRDIAESLVSFDAGLPSSEARVVLQRRAFREAGVREGGLITGWVGVADLAAGGTCGDRVHEFDDDEVTSQDASLAQALEKLARHQRVFVTAFGRVAGIVTWSDFQKPPARMWVFGLVTLVEMALTGMVDTFYPEDSWSKLVTPHRRRKAEEVQAYRQRGHGQVRLVDCLQLSDKGQILLRREDTRRLLGGGSKEAAEKRLRRLVNLRDSLAHAHDIVSADGAAIVEVARAMENVLGLGGVFAVPVRTRPVTPP
jgi:hypothetical protein